MTIDKEYRLAVIILNYRTPQLVIDCLASLEGQIDGVENCALVVDNCSGDDSAELIEQAITEHGWQTWAKVIIAPSNNGFSAGNNVGMQAVNATAYWLTNSDTIFRPNAVAELAHALMLHPKAGMISPRLEWPDGTPQISCFRAISPLSELLDSAKTGPLSKILNRYEVPLAVSNTPMRPEWTSFASVLLRREAVQQVGWMDEGFFMYFEDVDYGLRLRKAGWEILHWPAARVVHLRGGTSEVKAATQARKRRPRYFYAARNRYLAKHYGGAIGLGLRNSLWLFGRFISLIREKIGNKQPHTCEHEAEDIWINWRNPLNHQH